MAVVTACKSLAATVMCVIGALSKSCATHASAWVQRLSSRTNASAGLVRAEKISGAKKEPITCLYTLRHWILLKYEIRLRLVKARLE